MTSPREDQEQRERINVAQVGTGLVLSAGIVALLLSDGLTEQPLDLTRAVLCLGLSANLAFALRGVVRHLGGSVLADSARDSLRWNTILLTLFCALAVVWAVATQFYFAVAIFGVMTILGSGLVPWGRRHSASNEDEAAATDNGLHR